MTDQALKTALADPATNTQTRETTSVRQATPRLTANGLSMLLAIMCAVPVVTIFGLWWYLPPVYEGQLDALAVGVGLPPAEFYNKPFKERTPVTGGELQLTNQSDEEWTLINVMINSNYQIYDTDPLRPGETRSYLLNRFVSRTGARFDLKYNPLKTVRVYARRPRGDRATYYRDFTTSPQN